MVQWKRFTTENNTWEREEDLGNARELVDEFEERLSAKVKRQEKVEQEERINRNPRAEYKRSKLPGRYMVKLL